MIKIFKRIFNIILAIIVVSLWSYYEIYLNSLEFIYVNSQEAKQIIDENDKKMNQWFQKYNITVKEHESFSDLGSLYVYYIFEKSDENKKNLKKAILNENFQATENDEDIFCKRNNLIYFYNHLYTYNEILEWEYNPKHEKLGSNAYYHGTKLCD